MSLFRKAGSEFERAKRAVIGNEEAAFVCTSCEEDLSEEHSHCPHCGEAAVESLE
jgi:predicted RNA-binding Zn-ribbon protein involved in translation (DUF1610 family)